MTLMMKVMERAGRMKMDEITEDDILQFLLLNKEQILEDIKPDCIKFFERRSLFQGVFVIPFYKAFDEFIFNSIKEIILKHYLQHHLVHGIIFPDNIKKYTGDYFFDRRKYVNKD